MRSSKSRSRSNKNRNRSVGNITNRVFDSSGPEGKVRGTPQQIIDKYNQLARDAQLAGDRVATENFQQHAEHYLRLLAEAQREQEAKREEQERQNRERQAERDRERASRQERESNGGGKSGPSQQQPKSDAGDPGSEPQPDLIDTAESADSGLVETPESSAPKPKPKPRTRRKPALKPDSTSEAADTPATPDGGGEPEAAE
ncbi:MAG: nucleoside triphosphate hydrolase [Rhodobacterales bacterium]|nr:MAG: nucleoside triphosphate hydrolase [Rhodobacterales bacterium]